MSIQACPDELLERIFKLGCEADMDGFGFFRNPVSVPRHLKPFVRPVSQTCFQWRSVILQNRSPVFWRTKLCLPTDNDLGADPAAALANVRACLMTCERSDLDISIPFGQYSNNPSGNGLMLHAMSMIASFKNLIWRLYVPFDALAPLLEAAPDPSLPRLQCLALLKVELTPDLFNLHSVELFDSKRVAGEPLDLRKALTLTHLLAATALDSDAFLFEAILPPRNVTELTVGPLIQIRSEDNYDHMASFLSGVPYLRKLNILAFTISLDIEELRRRDLSFAPLQNSIEELHICTDPQSLFKFLNIFSGSSLTFLHYVMIEFGDVTDTPKPVDPLLGLLGSLRKIDLELPGWHPICDDILRSAADPAELRIRIACHWKDAWRKTPLESPLPSFRKCTLVHRRDPSFVDSTRCETLLFVLSRMNLESTTTIEIRGPIDIDLYELVLAVQAPVLRKLSFSVEIPHEVDVVTNLIMAPALEELDIHDSQALKRPLWPRKFPFEGRPFPLGATVTNLSITIAAVPVYDDDENPFLLFKKLRTLKIRFIWDVGEVRADVTPTAWLFDPGLGQELTRLHFILDDPSDKEIFISTLSEWCNYWTDEQHLLVEEASVLAPGPKDWDLRFTEPFRVLWKYAEVV